MDTILFDIPLSRAPPDLEALKQARVPGQEKHSLRGRRPVLDEHLAGVRTTFAGDPQIDFYHAALSVLIRRGMDTPLAIERFERLWSEQGGHLLASLDARWLVSACDTLMDCAN